MNYRRPLRAALPVGWAENVAPVLGPVHREGWADGLRIENGSVRRIPPAVIPGVAHRDSFGVWQFTLSGMDTAQLISEIDSELSRLQQARALLSGRDSATQPKLARKKRTLSPEARARIAAAQKLRWAKQKRAAKKSA